MFQLIKPRILVLAAAATLSIGAGLSSYFDLIEPVRAITKQEATERRTERATGARSLPDFATLANKLSPAVVNISTVQIHEPDRSMPGPFGEGHPFNEFRRRFGEPIPRGQSRERSLGSGVIVSADGLILTNNHVIGNADEIRVRLSDKREFQAKIVGKDPKTDIALLKIDAEETLPAAPLGDSNLVQVGEWVLAVGNPFGLDHTVTSGIVSAKGRRIGAGPYDDFIQTDASINPGNSGGPLINTGGEVIGINTAIFSRSGGNIGIGFAIPINLVKNLLPQLKEHGKVTRGWLGVTIQKMTSRLGESLGLAAPHGALVANVVKGGPAEQGGLRVGDVIVEFDGNEIKESADLPLLVAATPVGERVAVKVLRKGNETALEVTTGELRDDRVLASAPEKGAFGLAAREMTPETAQRLGMERPRGVVVSEVEPGSPADDAGLRRGDVVLEVDRRPITSLEDFLEATAESPTGKSALFLVWRNGTTLFFGVKNYG